jgi:hypothetical protein
MPSISRGNDHGRAALGLRSNAGRLRVRIVPAISIHRVDNEHPRRDYRTAEPSDSPPRASRYAPVCRAPLKREPARSAVFLECRDSFPGSLRRSLHGSGRSAASRHPYLSFSDLRSGLCGACHVIVGSPASDPAQVGRYGRERRGANPREVELISPLLAQIVCLTVATACTKAPSITGAFPPARCAFGRRDAPCAAAVDGSGAGSASAARRNAGYGGRASTPAVLATGTFPSPTSRGR